MVLLLKELLANDIYEHTRILAGTHGLMKEVQTVNIMDAPDIIRYLRPGELLLTNGYFMKQQPGMLLELMRNMQRLGCSGMAIKTKRFELAIPEEVLREAERLQFPLLEISAVRLSLGEILQRSTSLILNNKNDELQYALHIHKQFSEMVLQGKGLSGIIHTLSNLLSSPVLLLGSKLQTLGASSHFQDEELSQLAAVAGAVLDSTTASLSPASLCLTDPRHRQYSQVQVYPVHTYRHEGYLLSFHPPDRTSGLYGLTLEQASNVIGMEITKAQAVKERSRRYKNDYFSDLIDGYISSEQEALNRGKIYGLKNAGTWVMLTARKDEPSLETSGSLDYAAGGGHEDRNVSDRDQLYDRIKRQFAAIARPFVMFTKNDSFGLLLHIPDTEWDAAALIRQLNGMIETFYAEDGLSLSIGIGKPASNVLGIRSSYEEAVKALQFGYRLKRIRFVQSYQSKDIGYLFHMLPYEELKQFYKETFQGLEHTDEAERKELLRTLTAFYDTQCQILEASKLLYVHRNTVVYRLDKCEKLLGVKLKDPLESLRLRIALAIEPLLIGRGSDGKG